MEWRGTAPAADRRLVGRREERAALEALLGAVREGFGGGLVLTGEPGVGKTRLLEYAAQRAVEKSGETDRIHAIERVHGIDRTDQPDKTDKTDPTDPADPLDDADPLAVVRLVGVETETRLAYGGLHRLLRPFLSGRTALPPHLRDALDGAFGLSAGTPADRFLVGLATLTLLAGAAADRPLLCLVDDVHWLDRESVDALAFVARRLHADSLGMVFAARENTEHLRSLSALPVLPVSGLPPDHAQTLLASEVTGRLDPAVADRIVAGTGGNPLALLELASRLGPEQLAGLARLPEPLPVHRLLEDHFRRAVTALPPDTQDLLLLIAATPTDDPAALWYAAGALGVTARAAAPAVREGLLSRGSTIGFRHPLIRSAVYSAADPGQRRRVHAALAAACAPDRRAWHLAEAADGPDDAVAAELDAASARAHARGGYSEQALFLARAAELTTDPAVRAARCLQAAAAYLIVGDAGAVQRQLDLAAPDLAGPVARARAKRIQACTEMLLARAGRVAVTLLEAVDRLGAADPAMTWDLLYEALAAAIVSADLTRGTTLPLVARRAAGAWHDPAPPPWSSGPLMYGLALGLGHGYARGVPVLRDALRTMRDCETVRETGIPLSVTIAHAADQLWDIEAKRELAQRVAEQDRRHGALHGLSLAQVVLAAADISDGRFAAAEARYSENDEYAGAAGVVIHGDLTRPLLYAWTGREAELRRGVETMAGIAAGAGLGSLNRIADQAQAVFEIGSGRYGRALEHVRRLFDDDTVALGNVTLALMVEAGIRAGDRAAALAAFERIEHRAPLAGTPWALGSLARCRAMLAADDDAEPYYRESIERLGEVPVAMELAWSQLVYGEWLRRRRRRSDARVQLRAAFEAFDSRGAAPFAERARAELLASGETARKRTIDTRFDLTPQERQVALLATSGLTNGEIATRLFVTTATIEFHLSKVFRKLGITSRRQIASVLGTGEPAP